MSSAGDAVTFAASDGIACLKWSFDGSALAVVPAQGEIAVIDSPGRVSALLPDHGLGNAWADWSPDGPILCTAGYDGHVRLHDFSRGAVVSTSIAVGRSWIEHVRWNADGTNFAAAAGKDLRIYSATGEPVQHWDAHQGSVCDFSWNPVESAEIAAVGNGGATMWRMGDSAPFARFDWGGASLISVWSPDGRWLVTGDQTPSVHLFDFTRDHPLHIQGYDAKVKALAFDPSGHNLASGGGSLITIWDCTPATGPEGTVPRQIEAHRGEVLCLGYHPVGDHALASGGSDGILIVHDGEADAPRIVHPMESSVTTLAWHPTESKIAAGTAGGHVAILTV